MWNRKVARLPEHGILLFATDLQGNYDDYRTLTDIYAREERAGNLPFLLFCGDLVHGPGPDMAESTDWPDHLGSFYRDQSVELVRDYMAFSRTARTVSLLGNHEHAHIGGPRVSKFYEDEAGALDAALGEDRQQVAEFFCSFPLLAVARCGARFTHGAPRMAEPDLEAFEDLDYRGYAHLSMNDMYDLDTLASLLWARAASPEQARAFLQATAVDGEAGTFVAYGHDVVREGYEKVGAEQICVSTSYGLYDRDKVYLRLDLTRRYRSVDDLREGEEIRLLYDSPAG